MKLTNSLDRYGLVARSLHWLTALLILILLPLGLIAEEWPHTSAEQLAVKVQLFSLHKTLGVTVFFVALGRILWGASQPRPVLLNNNKPLERNLAETIHWLLYVSLVATPLTGWIHHAATEGFAPIWWPFGQSLPFVPVSQSVAALFSGLHLIAVILLVLSLGLHIAGALKHHVIDRDATLRRMISGVSAGDPNAAPQHHRLPKIAALAVVFLAVSAGDVANVYVPETEGRESVALSEVETGWQVQQGTLAITVRQMGSDVTGSFADWTAAIDFAEAPTDGRHGTADVTIAIGSLTLGSVTDQAMGADYFDVASFPTATFRAELLPADDGTFLAKGTLKLRGVEIPVSMPFVLSIDGDTATMTAETTLDRRDFHIGDSQPGESSLGFAVIVAIDLVADRVGKSAPAGANNT